MAEKKSRTDEKEYRVVPVDNIEVSLNNASLLLMIFKRESLILISSF